MNGATVLLEEFATELRDLCNAVGAAVLVHLEPPQQSGLMLANSGEQLPPELVNEEAAWNFIVEQKSLRGQREGEDHIRQQTSGDGISALICLPLSRILPRPAEHAALTDERRQHPRVHAAPALDGKIWIGLNSATKVDQLVELLQGFEADGSAPQSGEAQLARFVTLSARLAWQVYHLSRVQRDPVSQLPGRMEFEVFLNRVLAAARANSQPLGMLLINPDDFVMVNHRFGRELGDHAVREIAERLSKCVRETDGVFRYGGAAFGVVLPATDLASTRAAAEKFRRQLSEAPYLGDSLELVFTIGGAVADLDALQLPDLEPADMVQRADNALNRAKLSGGGQILLSSMSESSAGLSHFDPLSGIFTTDSEKDYRNMLLLWETVSLVSSTPDPELIARSFVDLLGARFRPDRLALLKDEAPAGLQALATNVRDDAAADGRAMGRDVRLNQKQSKAIHSALSSGHVERHRDGEAESPLGSTAYAIPLMAGKKAIGCLFLDGINRRLQLDSTDLIFLNALADQVAIALDRAALSASWIRDKEQESRQLGEQVRELRQVLGHSKLVYESPQMQEVLNTLKRVAPSDATVLIIGESGTGKEMLAQSVHTFSRRHASPFVTVDCGAIAHSLLEAELFGHVKGAFTGAESASEGRIAQADGGTLFLDEIGELPLDVQAKLLRFVQERELTPVGGNSTRVVDVRIVAATNRQLKDDVAAGRFRQDLYYRLQVVPIQAVPLRDRPDDIMPLARFFVGKFAALYGSNCQQIGSDAQRLLQAHTWPGNVRELQHCIQRAVLMTDDEVLAAEDIELHPESDREPETASRFQDFSTSNQHVQETNHAETENSSAVAGDPWQALNDELTAQVEIALSSNAQRPVPIGRWLQEDLVLAASIASGDVARRAARLAGVPESTFRRQLDKARMEAEAGLAARTEAWQQISPVLQELVQCAAYREGGDLLDGARLTLLRIVCERVSDSNTVGASLMGVTPPTYKRWLMDQAA